MKFFEDFKLHNDADVDYSDYDKLSYWQYSDKFLKIHKILNGANKGKIQFRFFDKDAGVGNEFSNKYSMMFGATKLLNTKYVDLPEIREITLGPVLFRKVPTNTMESIIREFTEKIDFSSYDNPDDKDNFLINRILSSATTLRYEDRIREIALKSENLGEVFDKLKIISDEAYEFQKELYDKMKLELDIKKYNM